MGGILKRIFSPRCDHDWKCVHQTRYKIYDEESDRYPAETYLEKAWECQKCGKVKYTRIDL